MNMKIRLFPLCVLLSALVFLPGCDRNGDSQNQSTVTVYGTGTVMVRPDMIQMTVSLSKTAGTTKEAREDVNAMVARTLDILANSGIEEKNISTASLTFNPEYEYTSGKRELIGQKAEQRITFNVDDIRDSDKNISAILDQLIQINGIELNQTSFNVKNNTEYFERSRELAFQKAAEKAEQYAELSGLKVSKVLNISEEGIQPVFPMSANNRMVNQMTFAEAQSDTGSTLLPAGELEVTSRITAMFLLEGK